MEQDAHHFPLGPMVHQDFRSKRPSTDSPPTPARRVIPRNTQNPLAQDHVSNRASPLTVGSARVHLLSRSNRAVDPGLYSISPRSDVAFAGVSPFLPFFPPRATMWISPRPLHCFHEKPPCRHIGRVVLWSMLDGRGRDMRAEVLSAVSDGMASAVVLLMIIDVLLGVGAQAGGVAA